jgi:hypothetical protein
LGLIIRKPPAPLEVAPLESLKMAEL